MKIRDNALHKHLFLSWKSAYKILSTSIFNVERFIKKMFFHCCLFSITHESKRRHPVLGNTFCFRFLGHKDDWHVITPLITSTISCRRMKNLSVLFLTYLLLCFFCKKTKSPWWNFCVITGFSDGDFLPSCHREIIQYMYIVHTVNWVPLSQIRRIRKFQSLSPYRHWILNISTFDDNSKQQTVALMKDFPLLISMLLTVKDKKDFDTIPLFLYGKTLLVYIYCTRFDISCFINLPVVTTVTYHCVSNK